MTEKELVKICLTEICRKNGIVDTSTMVQRDFEHISQSIDENTGVLISLSTIKRLLNGEFSRTPQIATLNAIAAYLGFKSWREYKSSMQNDVGYILPEPRSEEVILKKNPQPKIRFNWKWVGVAAVVTGIVIFLSFRGSSYEKKANYDKAQFSAKKTTANAIPNTVIFNYNVDEIDADSFFIQQSWDKRTRVKVEKHNYTLTDIYYEPGYHIAKLMANDSIIKTIDVSIPTDRWFLFAKDQDLKGIPQYIKDSAAFKAGFLGLNKNDLDDSHIKTDEDKAFFYEYFPSKLEVNSDNFTFKTRVRMKQVKNNQCPYIVCEVFCQRNFTYLKSMPMGCASEVSAHFGENELLGKRTNLSSLCFDVSKWTDIEMTVKNKAATIFINDKQVYTCTYNNSSGLITGLGFISNGLCEVDFVELKGLNKKVVFKDDFRRSNY